MKATLWCLSNVCSGTTSHVAAFLQTDGLVEKVFETSRSETISISGESMWTICNLIMTGSYSSLLNVYVEHPDDLVKAMCDGLCNPHLTDAKLLITMISATSKLLSLDHEFSDDLIDKVKDKFV